MKLHSWLMAQTYDWAMRKTEQRCLYGWRRELLQHACGKLLEIGTGTGVNLSHYPPTLSGMTLCEPDPQMRRRLRNKLANSNTRDIQLTDWSAEQIELPDHSCDTVVSTLVLCSVSNQQQSINELYRILRPGGQLLFLEHVVAANQKTIRWQKFYEPLWRRCSGNCHLTRNTLATIEASGMRIEKLQEDDIVGAPAILRRTVRGLARKPHNVDN